MGGLLTRGVATKSWPPLLLTQTLWSYVCMLNLIRVCPPSTPPTKINYQHTSLCDFQMGRKWTATITQYVVHLRSEAVMSQFKVICTNHEQQVFTSYTEDMITGINIRLKIPATPFTHTFRSRMAIHPSREDRRSSSPTFCDWLCSHSPSPACRYNYKLPSRMNELNNPAQSKAAV